MGNVAKINLRRENSSNVIRSETCLMHVEFNIVHVRKGLPVGGFQAARNGKQPSEGATFHNALQKIF